MSLTSVAAAIRNGWFGLLGSTKGFPYGTNLFFQVAVAVTVWMPDGYATTGAGLPATLTLNVVDSAGNVAGTATLTVTGLTQWFAVQGSFDEDETYSIEATGASPLTVYLAPPPDASADPGTFGQPGTSGTTEATSIPGSSLNVVPVWLSILVGTASGSTGPGSSTGSGGSGSTGTGGGTPPSTSPPPAPGPKSVNG